MRQRCVHRCRRTHRGDYRPCVKVPVQVVRELHLFVSYFVYNKLFRFWFRLVWFRFFICPWGVGGGQDRTPVSAFDAAVDVSKKETADRVTRFPARPVDFTLMSVCLS